MTNVDTFIIIKIQKTNKCSAEEKFMNLTGTLLTIFEIALVAFVIWAVFHEDRFIAFEDRIVAHFRRRKLKVIEGNNVAKSYYPQKHRA